MLKEQSAVNAFFINFIFGVVWHYAVLFVCISLDNCIFSPQRKMYRCHKWERGGKFYSDVLKINKWKEISRQVYFGNVSGRVESQNELCICSSAVWDKWNYRSICYTVVCNGCGKRAFHLHTEIQPFQASET